MTATELDRSVPSRELDAAVMSVFGWSPESTVWHHIERGLWKTGVIPYSTATDSTHWAEMIAWMKGTLKCDIWIQLQVHKSGDMLGACVTWSGERGEAIVAPTIGHALSLAVLSVSERLERDTNGL